jgi:tRNA A58 N-methylase Trm61
VDHSLAIVYNNAHVYLYIFIHTFWKFAWPNIENESNIWQRNHF